MYNHALKSGLIVGVVSIVITLLIYVVDATMLVKWWFGLIALAIGLALVSYFGIQFRNEGTGFLTFGKSWIYSMVTFLVSGLLSTIFSILLYQVIDPELPEILTETSIENSVEIMRNFGTPDEVIDESVEKMREDMPGNFTVLGTIKSYGIAIIIYAVLGLITGLIIKKKEPEFE